MDKINRKILKDFNKTRSHKRLLCNAPFVSMSIDSTGFVSPCCYVHSQTDFLINNSDRYPGNKLLDVWRGSNFGRYRKCMKNNIFPAECAICKDDIVSGKFDSVKLKMYDRYEPHKSYPRIIEITADNICNLQCIMCSSVHSSQIAKKHNVIIKNNTFNSPIVDEFYEFIPYLEEVIFSGGEPFLSPLCISLIKSILSLNNKCLISVNTNGTVLTEEIKQLMETGTFHFNISLDSINKTTYEQIRLGAHFETVMKNIQYFSDYSKKVKNSIVVPVCPLTINYKELPEIIEFCNRHSFHILFVHVFNAHDVALISAEPELLSDAIRIYETASISANGEIPEQNALVFQGLIDELKQTLVFNQKKNEFVKNLMADENMFFDDNVLLEEKILKYITKSVRENAKNSFETWKNKKDQVFAQLPEYYKSENIYRPLFDFPEEMLFFYFDQLPVHELKNYLITFCNEIIKKKVN